MASANILTATPTTAAVNVIVGPVLNNIDTARGVLLQAAFTYGSGGTTLKAWIQSTVDGGTTWFDVACFAFTTASKTRIANLRAATAVTSLATPGDAALADDTVVDGILGDQIRVKYTSTGTYVASTLVISAVTR